MTTDSTALIAEARADAAKWGVMTGTSALLLRLADALEARVQITDEMVTRAAASVHEWELSDVPVWVERAIARAALEAALNHQSNEQEQSNG